jgi:hypothetical protein
MISSQPVSAPILLMLRGVPRGANIISPGPRLSLAADSLKVSVMRPS